MPSASPRDLIFTLFGDYLLERDVPVWVGSLLTLLEPLGVSEGAARTALSRMSARGWLTSERRGRNAFYSLTPRGRRLLEEGRRRIYRPTWDDPWDGLWRLVTYSIPEADRTLRDRLRVRLSWIGFGSLGNGLWITPHEAFDRVEEAVTELDVVDRVETFEARHLGFSEAGGLVARCWDLPAIHARYVDFIDRHLPEHRRLRARRRAGELRPEEAYAHRFRLVHEFREFAQMDPYLPRELLPEDWAGECAAGLFRELHGLLEEPSEAHVDAVVARAEHETDATVDLDEVRSGTGGSA